VIEHEGRVGPLIDGAEIGDGSELAKLVSEGGFARSSDEAFVGEPVSDEIGYRDDL
jgi:hypothetical protein